MKKILLFVLLIIVNFNIWSQDTKSKNICEQIFYFSENIKFPNESNIQTYKIAVFGKSSPVYNTLYLLYINKKIKQKSISIKNINKTKELDEGFNIVFVDKSKNKSLKEIYEALDGKQTLVITNDATDNKYFMINLRGDGKEYDINNFNLIDEGFSVPEKLLATGGSRLDLQKLYQQKVNQLNIKTNQLKQKDKQLEIKDKQLKEKEEKLKNIEKDLKEEQKRLDSLNEIVKIQKRENKEKEKQLNKKDLELKDKELTIQKQAEALNIQNIKLRFQRKIIILSVTSAIIFLILSLIIYYQLRVNKRITNELRQKNEEIRTQKEQIEEQAKEIEKQRDLAVERGNELAKKNKEIQDSINYAERIQRALLPDVQFLSSIFAEHFIWYKPRDAVSGDFYWAIQKANKTIVCAADCTGHGVPGAMMSMLGMSFLNQIAEGITTPNVSEILRDLSNLVIVSLKQNLSEDFRSKEGIDLSMIIFDSEKLTIDYAGANNSIYIVAKQKPTIISGFEEFRILNSDSNDFTLYEIHADDRPIGVYNTEPVFITKTVQLQKGDSIYMFSDGFPDLYNFQKRKKYGSVRFKQLLLANANNNLQQQLIAIEQEYTNWLEQFRQVDDILIIGLKI